MLCNLKALLFRYHPLSSMDFDLSQGKGDSEFQDFPALDAHTQTLEKHSKT